MKVLSITNLCHGYSASLPERYLYKGLAERGIDLTVITHFPTPESHELELAGIKMVYIEIRKKFDPAVIRSIRKLIREEKVEILHITFGKALTNGLLASKGLSCKIVAYLGSIRLYWHDPFSWISYLNPRVDRLICLSKGVQEHVLRQAPRRMKGKTVQIYKAYERSWFSGVVPFARENLGIPPDGFIICCVANVRKVKGIPWLIKATSMLPMNLPLYFLLIGPGMDSEPIRELISGSLYRDNFRTIGFTNQVFSYVSASDLYIQPSLSEGLGRSVIEAMFLGKPVIATGRGGVKELIDEGISGFYMPLPSAEEIAEKINYSFENRHLLRSMGENGRERIINILKPSETIERTCNLFYSLVR